MILGEKFFSAIACGPPQAAVANGRIECGTQDYSYQSRCVVSCDAGYDIESNDIITCQADKTWTEPGQCVGKRATCVVISILPLICRFLEARRE